MSTLNGANVNYDGMGNMTSGGLGATLSYGDSGRLAQVDISTVEAELYLLYNGLGELARARKTAVDACGVTNETYREYYHFAPDGRALHLVQEVVNRVQVDWVWLDNLPVLQFQDTYDPNGTLIGTQTTYLHPDHLGTPRIGTDANGASSWRFRSDGFGKATISGAHNVRLRFPGQIDLAFQGINYNYFRSYDPNTGRYLESDPIGSLVPLAQPVGHDILASARFSRTGLLSPDALALNHSYVYASSNPLLRIDPLGLFDRDDLRKRFCKKGNESCDSLHKRLLQFCFSRGGAFYACKVFADEMAVDCILGGFPTCDDDGGGGGGANAGNTPPRQSKSIVIRACL